MAKSLVFVIPFQVLVLLALGSASPTFLGNIRKQLSKRLLLVYGNLLLLLLMVLFLRQGNSTGQDKSFADIAVTLAWLLMHYS